MAKIITNFKEPTETQRQVAHQKKFLDIDYVPYPRHIVEAIDALIDFKKSRGVPDVVDSDAAWEVVVKCFNVWQTLYPQDYERFFVSQKSKWASLANEYGSAKGEGGAEIRKVAEVPEKLHQILKVMFPYQKWDKKFYAKLTSKLPLLRGSIKK